MKLETFFERFDQFAEAPDAVAKVRELALNLAAQGKLVERQASEGDGHTLLKKLRTLPPERNSKSRSPKDITVEPETPLEIPGHWALTTVENTTRDTGFFCDGDWVESKDQDPDGDVRLIQLADVGDGRYRDRSLRFMTKEAAKRLNCSYLEAGDILVARMPDPLGRCCRFPGDPKPAVTVVDVCILRSNITFFDPDFLVIAINSPQFRQLVSAQATGTTRSRISRSNLGVLPIPLPPLAEQKRIVAKVDELMVLCDRLEAQEQEGEIRRGELTRASLARFADAPTPASLNFIFHKSYDIPPANLRKSILTLAVQGKLVPQDPNDEPAEEAIRHVPPQRRPARFDKRSNANIQGIAALSVGPTERDIPTGWSCVPLIEIARLESGHTPSRSRPDWWGGDVSWVGVVDARLHNGKTIFETLQHTNEQGLANSAARMLPAGTVCVSRTASVGYVTILGKPMATSQDFVNWVPSKAVTSDWLQLVFTSEKDAFSRFSKGAVHQTIYYPEWLSMHTMLPPLAEQRRIVAKVEQLMALVDALETQLAASRATAANLLSALVAELTNPMPNTARQQKAA